MFFNQSSGCPTLINVVLLSISRRHNKTVGLGTRKGRHSLNIWVVTLSCLGMVDNLEVSSPHTWKSSWNLVSCWIRSGPVSFCCESPSTTGDDDQKVESWRSSFNPYNPWATTGSKGPGVLESINRTLTHSIWKHKHSVNTEVRKDFKVSVITESTSRLY